MIKKIKNAVNFNFSLIVFYGFPQYLCSNFKRSLHTKFSTTVFHTHKESLRNKTVNCRVDKSHQIIQLREKIMKFKVLTYPLMSIQIFRDVILCEKARICQ